MSAIVRILALVMTLGGGCARVHIRREALEANRRDGRSWRRQHWPARTCGAQLSDSSVALTSAAEVDLQAADVDNSVHAPQEIHAENALIAKP